jgi:hypothetical protein
VSSFLFQSNTIDYFLGIPSSTRGHHFYDKFAAQLMMPPECALLQLVALDNPLVDDELAAQMMMPPECAVCPPTRGNGRALGGRRIGGATDEASGLVHLQINSQSPGEERSLE